MRLCYRGVHYDSVPPTASVTEGEVLGNYRGLPWREHLVQEVSIAQPSFYLKYRGVPYWSHQAASAGQVVAPRTAQAMPVAMPALGVETYGVTSRFPREKQRLADVAGVHQQTLRQILNHRLEIARQRGDQNLIHLLEAEQQQIA